MSRTSRPSIQNHSSLLSSLPNLQLILMSFVNDRLIVCMGSWLPLSKYVWNTVSLCLLVMFCLVCVRMVDFSRFYPWVHQWLGESHITVYHSASVHGFDEFVFGCCEPQYGCEASFDCCENLHAAWSIQKSFQKSVELKPRVSRFTTKVQPVQGCGDPLAVPELT